MYFLHKQIENQNQLHNCTICYSVAVAGASTNFRKEISVLVQPVPSKFATSHKAARRYFFFYWPREAFDTNVPNINVCNYALIADLVE